jgi:selenocysteine lyase/cysteine desulfurase
MTVDRRRFILTAGLSVTGGALAPSVARSAGLAGTPATAAAPGDWAWVRDQFDASRDWAHFASFYITSHPRPVREAIDKLRRELDENPFAVVEHGLFIRPQEVRTAAASYLGGTPDEIALTRCTTEGLSLVYAGLALRPGQEILTTTHDHYSHYEAIRLAGRRGGASERRIALYDDPARAAEDEIVDRLRRALGPKTRAVGITWVHSSTGVKIPVRRVADAIAEANKARASADRILLIVDGVHGFGVEDEPVAALGCDFFAAGTHKWIFGPRGTGILWGRRDAWPPVQPTIPPFEMGPFGAWLEGRAPGPTQGAWVSPGGFHAYEHMWALPAAFAFHGQIGRSRIAGRIHELNVRIKEGLATVPGLKLHTPRDVRLSSGLVAFEVAGKTPEDVVHRLAARRIVASTSPYKPSYVRLAGSLLNTPEEVDMAVRAVRELGAAS